MDFEDRLGLQGRVGVSVLVAFVSFCSGFLFLLLLVRVVLWQGPSACYQVSLQTLRYIRRLLVSGLCF